MDIYATFSSSKLSRPQLSTTNHLLVIQPISYVCPTALIKNEFSFDESEFDTSDCVEYVYANGGIFLFWCPKKSWNFLSWRFFYLVSNFFLKISEVAVQPSNSSLTDLDSVYSSPGINNGQIGENRNILVNIYRDRLLLLARRRPFRARDKLKEKSQIDSEIRKGKTSHAPKKKRSKERERERKMETRGMFIWNFYGYKRREMKNDWINPSCGTLAVTATKRSVY